MAAHRERSRCPIAYCLDVVGDRWTLLVLRDLAFKNRRYFQDFMTSPERIASNVLADRLRRLEQWKLVEGHPDPDDGRRIRYFLTDDGLDLIPLLVELTIWGTERHPNPSVPREEAHRMRADREGTVRRIRERLRSEREAAIHA